MEFLECKPGGPTHPVGQFTHGVGLPILLLRLQLFLWRSTLKPCERSWMIGKCSQNCQPVGLVANQKMHQGNTNAQWKDLGYPWHLVLCNGWTYLFQGPPNWRWISSCWSSPYIYSAHCLPSSQEHSDILPSVWGEWDCGQTCLLAAHWYLEIFVDQWAVATLGWIGSQGEKHRSYCLHSGNFTGMNMDLMKSFRWQGTTRSN